MTGRDEIATPALLLDLDRLEANIATMVAHAKAVGVGLRCHAKSHKSADIARMLARAGALGPACATIQEAEAMADAGLAGILVTAPLITPAQIARIGRLLARGADLSLVLDSTIALPAYGAIARANGRELPILVELDVGQGRTGYHDLGQAVEFARAVAAAPGLRFAGVQAYWGHLQHVTGFADRKSRVVEQSLRLKALLDLLREAGLPAGIVTGGGTGTIAIDPGLGLFTELQPGSFLFQDSSYIVNENAPGGPVFVPSLFVAAAVISANRPGRVIVNAGIKCFACDSGLPTAQRNAPEGAVYRFMGDEHGALDFAASSNGVALGTVVELLTSHCDPTVNLHSHYVVVRGDAVVDTWQIAARGY